MRSDWLFKLHQSCFAYFRMAAIHYHSPSPLTSLINCYYHGLLSLLKTGLSDNAIPAGVFIGLAPMRYQPLFHAREIAAVKSFSCLS